MDSIFKCNKAGCLIKLGVKSALKGLQINHGLLANSPPIAICTG